MSLAARLSTSFRCPLAALTLAACVSLVPAGSRAAADSPMRLAAPGLSLEPNAIQGPLTCWLVSAVPGPGSGALSAFVSTFTGGLVLQQRLLVAPALGHDWYLALYHQSLLADEPSSLGPGWRHSFMVDVRPGVPAANAVTVRWGDGREDVFTDDGAGGWSGGGKLFGARVAPIAGGYELSTKHGERYRFDGAGRLVALLDRSGNATTLAYLSGRLATVTDPSGRSCHWSYDVAGRLVRIDGLPAQPIEFQYDAQDRLIRVLDPAGFPARYEYDLAGRMVRVEDAGGHATLLGYYPGMAVVEWARDGAAYRRFSYNADSLVTAVVDSIGPAQTSEVRYHLTNGCEIVRTDDSVLGTSTCTYDPTGGWIREWADPEGHVMRYEYDALGDLTKYTDAAAEDWTWSYEPVHHFPSVFTDPLGHAWSWSYDGAGNPIMVTDPLAAVERYSYDALGRCTRYEDALGNPWTFGYDGDSNLNTVTDPAGYTRSAEFNPRGVCTRVIDELGNAWSFALDPRDQVATVTPPAPAGAWTLSWTPSGQRDGIVDPLGGANHYLYDAADRLVRTQDELGGLTLLERDGNGAIVRATDPMGQSAQFTRDGAGRLLSRTGPNADTWSYAWSGCDLLAATDPAGNTAQLSYSPRHELQRLEWSGISNAYTYDAAGRLVDASRAVLGEPTIEYTYTYDAAGRVLQSQAVHLGRTVTYERNAAGDITRHTDDLQPTESRVSYDVRRLPASVSAGALASPTQLQFTPTGRLAAVVYPHGVRTDYLYDAPGRCVRVTNTTPSFVADYQLVHDARGSLVQQVSSTPAGGALTQSLTVDARGRITGEAYLPGPTPTTYAYDAADDRVAVTDGSGVSLYTYTPGHRLTGNATSSQVWNANARVDKFTSGPTTAYSYRADGTPSLLLQRRLSYQFRFGPFGELVWMRDALGTETWHVQDGDGQGIEWRDGMPVPAGTPRYELLYFAVWSDDRLNVEVKPIETPFSGYSFGSSYNLPDGTGSIGQRSDSLGALITDTYWSAFGSVRASLGTRPEEDGFLGMQEVSGFGLFLASTSVDPEPKVDPVEPHTPWRTYSLGTSHWGDARFHFLQSSAPWQPRDFEKGTLPPLKPLCLHRWLDHDVGTFYSPATGSIQTDFGLGTDCFQPPIVLMKPPVAGVVGGSSVDPDPSPATPFSTGPTIVRGPDLLIVPALTGRTLNGGSGSGTDGLQVPAIPVTGSARSSVRPVFWRPFSILH